MAKQWKVQLTDGAPARMTAVERRGGRGVESAEGAAGKAEQVSCMVTIGTMGVPLRTPLSGSGLFGLQRSMRLGFALSKG
ncbi:hypothetical protein Acidovoranil_03490 [Acidovorax sp. FG27]